MFELDLRLAARFGNQGKGILFAGHAVERRGEKLLGQPGIGLERRLGIPIKDLHGCVGKIRLRGGVDIGAAARHGFMGPFGDERALQKRFANLSCQLADAALSSRFNRFVEFLNVWIGGRPVLIEKLLAARTRRRQFFDFRIVPTEQEDRGLLLRSH